MEEDYYDPNDPNYVEDVPEDEQPRNPPKGKKVFIILFLNSLICIFCFFTLVIRLTCNAAFISGRNFTFIYFHSS